MWKIIYSTIFILRLAEINAQVPCRDEDLLAVKGTWAKNPDQNMRAGKYQAEINRRILEISKIFQAAYPNPKDVEARWYGSMDGTHVLDNGTVFYNFNSLYFSWYCNLRQQKMMRGTETGTWAYVAVNNLNWFISSQYDNPHLTINGKPVYQLPLKKAVWKGYSTYEGSAYRERSRCILLTGKNDLPWKTISQEEYLKAIRTQWQEQKKSSEDNFAKAEERLKNSIATNKESKILKDAQKSALNAGLQKQLDELLETKELKLAKFNKYMDDKIKVIDEYIGKASPAVLQSPAIIERGSGGGFNGSFTTEEKGGCTLVWIKEDYFDMKLPSYIPQLIVLFWRWENKATSLEFKKEIEENFDISALNSMLGK